MRAVFLIATILLVPMAAMAQADAERRIGPRQPNQSFHRIYEVDNPNGVRATRPAAGTATRQQARRNPAANRNRPATMPRAN